MILGIDSTAKSASVALVDSGKIISSFFFNNGFTHSETLLPMLEDVLKETHVSIDDIQVFACNVGPGSFTGVRIGVAMVKGLTFQKNIPCVAVSTLESMAYNLFPLDGIYCCVMDARRNQLYNAIFSCKNGDLTRLCEDRALSLEELVKEISQQYQGEKIYIVGDGYSIVAKEFEEKGIAYSQTPQSLRLQNAISTAFIGEKKYGLGQTVSDKELSPVYLRLSQAERERNEKIQ